MEFFYRSLLRENAMGSSSTPLHQAEPFLARFLAFILDFLEGYMWKPRMALVCFPVATAGYPPKLL